MTTSQHTSECGAAEDSNKKVIGRYALHGIVASGGMAAVHLGRLIGLAGFSRTVAIKRLHPNFARNPEFVSMLIDEARLAARVNHPNVVGVLDVVALEGELLLVMEYIHGESLSKLMHTCMGEEQQIPRRVFLTIMTAVLYGLHAAHEARSERGEPLNIVHRDVSPHNIMVGADGVPSLLDFGIAKATGRLQETREGMLKGKIRYMAPEQIMAGKGIDRRVDIYAASVVLWEGLTGKRLFDADTDWKVAFTIMEGATTPPSALTPGIPKELDAIVMKGLSKDPESRFGSAYEMAVAIEELGDTATAREIGQFVRTCAAEALGEREQKVAEVEGCQPPRGELPSYNSCIPPRPRSPRISISMEVQEVIPRGELCPEPPKSITAPARPLAIRNSRSEWPTPTPQPSLEPDRKDGDLSSSGTFEPPPSVRELGASKETTQRSSVVSPPQTRIRQKKAAWAVACSAGLILVLWASAAAYLQGTASELASRAESVASSFATATMALSWDQVSTAATPSEVSSVPSPAPPSSVGQVPGGERAATPATASSPRTLKARLKAKASRCSPPYYFENGVKRLKRECL